MKDKWTLQTQQLEEWLILLNEEDKETVMEQIRDILKQSQD